MDKHQFKIIILLVFVIALIGFIFVLSNKKQLKNEPNPLPVANAQVPSVSSVTSPDGKFTLTMTQKGTNYTFSSEKINFVKTVSAGTVLSIPLNTFSPDNKYIFLKEESSGQADFFVVTPSEDLDINALFLAKYSDLVITDVTGWAAPTLVIINTKDRSFWFDVASKSFISLSTRFN